MPQKMDVFECSAPQASNAPKLSQCHLGAEVGLGNLGNNYMFLAHVSCLFGALSTLWGDDVLRFV